MPIPWGRNVMKSRHPSAVPAAPRRPIRNFEHLHAIALNNWWIEYARYNALDYRLFFTIPNQGRGGGNKNSDNPEERKRWFMHMKRGKKMKAEGLRRGVPDYTLAIARGGFHGLFIELKEEAGRVSPDQKEMMALLTGEGYKCVVAYSAREATDAIEEYLKRPQFGDVSKVPPIK